jgi:hypothetical protein
MEKETIYALWMFFIAHVVVAAIANIFFILVNILTYPRELWFPLPLIIWGLIIFIHYQLTKLAIQGYFQDLKNNLVEKLNQTINVKKN